MNATVIFILSTCIGLIGGTFLVWKGVGIIRGLATSGSVTGASAAKGPIWTGIVLTGGNPQFLLWWVTVGLTLTSRAIEIGTVAFGLFALIHWLCDLVWQEALSCCWGIGCSRSFLAPARLP